MAQQELRWIPGVGGPFVETVDGSIHDQYLRVRLDYHPDFRPELTGAGPRLRLMVLRLFMAFVVGLAAVIFAM